MEFAIVLGIVAATAAALAQVLAHQFAERHRWRRIPRYVCGLTIINAAFAFPIFAALPIERAGILYGLLWLIGGASGLATWLAYENDKIPGRPDADSIIRQLDDELRKN